MERSADIDQPFPNAEDTEALLFSCRMVHRRDVESSSIICDKNPDLIIRAIDGDGHILRISVFRNVYKQFPRCPVQKRLDLIGQGQSLLGSLEVNVESFMLCELLAEFFNGRALRRREIEDGPLRGLQGIFEREMGDRERVVILLETLAQGARVEVRREQLERCERETVERVGLSPSIS